MADLTQEERNYAVQLLKHPVINKLFDELEQSHFNQALIAKPHEAELINSALGEVRAVQSLRRSLELISAEEAAKKKAAG